MDNFKINPIQFKDQHYSLKKYINRKVQKSKEMKNNTGVEENRVFKEDFDTLVRKSTCNHDPKSLDTTLIKSCKRTMVSPRRDDYICNVCHKCFSFIEEN